MARGPGSTSGLTPFKRGDGRAAAAGRKSAEARAIKRASERGDIVAMIGRLQTLADHAEGVDVSATCIGVAVYVLGLVTSGIVPIRHGGDAAELVRVLVDVARLTDGQPTSTSAVLHLSAADARARLAELASLAGASLAVGPAAGADPPPASSATTSTAAGTAGGPVLDVD